MVPVRVLVTIEPNMYREVVAFHIRNQRLQLEVFLASPEVLEDEAKSRRPHLIIANEVPPVLREVNVFWAALRTEEGLVADISADGYSTTIQDFSVEDLVGLVDRAEEDLAREEQQGR